MKLLEIDKFLKLKTERSNPDKFSEKEEYLIKIQSYSIQNNWQVSDTNNFIKTMSRIYGFRPKELKQEALRRYNVESSKPSGLLGKLKFLIKK